MRMGAAGDTVLNRRSAQSSFQQQECTQWETLCEWESQAAYLIVPQLWSTGKHMFYCKKMLRKENKETIAGSIEVSEIENRQID